MKDNKALIKRCVRSWLKQYGQRNKTCPFAGKTDECYCSSGNYKYCHDLFPEVSHKKLYGHPICPCHVLGEKAVVIRAQLFLAGELDD